jgi:NADPH:quinone reductase-like Zn-dependent oxidoreductase
MKAIVCKRFGSAEVLKLVDIEQPTPKSDQVLIQIHATTVTAGDCEIRSLRLTFIITFLLRTFIKFKTLILGMELAGEVISVGSKVKLFKKGDQVFAAPGFKAYAEFICLPENGPIALKPQNMNYVQAAALSVGGLNALHFIKKANIKQGNKVLIYGASGSIGTFAIQLANYFGADVTAVCSRGNFSLVKSLGAKETVDYKVEDFTKNGENYDVIFDTLGKSDFSKSLNSLTENGRYLLAAPKLSEKIKGSWISFRSPKKVITSFANHDFEKLIFLKKLVEEGKLNSVIDRCYSLDEIKEAHLYVEKGHKKGNVVITIDHI